MFVTITLVDQNCFVCGVPFAMAEHFQADRLRKQDTFYCPAGHSQHYIGETEAERQRKRAERAERAAESERQRRVAEERSHSATRGHLTRARTRAAHGVCQVCHRSFANVARHMTGQHPDYVKAHS